MRVTWGTLLGVPLIAAAAGTADGHVARMQSNSWTTIWRSNSAPATSACTWQGKDVTHGLPDRDPQAFAAVGETSSRDGVFIPVHQ